MGNSNNSLWGKYIQWKKKELGYLDRKTRKLITMHGRLHLRSNFQRF